MWKVWSEMGVLSTRCLKIWTNSADCTSETGNGGSLGSFMLGGKLQFSGKWMKSAMSLRQYVMLYKTFCPLWLPLEVDRNFVQPGDQVSRTSWTQCWSLCSLDLTVYLWVCVRQFSGPGGKGSGKSRCVLTEVTCAKTILFWVSLPWKSYATVSSVVKFAAVRGRLTVYCWFQSKPQQVLSSLSWLIMDRMLCLFQGVQWHFRSFVGCCVWWNYWHQFWRIWRNFVWESNSNGNQ